MSPTSSPPTETCSEGPIVTLLKATSVPSRTPTLDNRWEFAGWGSRYRMRVVAHLDCEGERHETVTTENWDRESVASLKGANVGLGAWAATSISANDLLSSVLFSVSLTTTAAGIYSPISMAFVCLALYPFQNILSEVVTALPLNGGSYNCILNTSSKTMAAVAAALSVLSYTATAVVCGASATAYAAGELGNLVSTNTFIFWGTIVVLCLFAFIVFLGMEESSVVAFAIFGVHCLVLAILSIVCIIRWIERGNQVLLANFNMPWGTGNVGKDIFFGYCVGLLGITGFETSSNFVEEQKPGVYQKTMRNMFLCVLITNPFLALLSIATLPLSVIRDNPASMFAVLGDVSGGPWLRLLVVIDAVIVLCAGVLTAFVGVSGLIERMASDHILPLILLRKNRWTGTNHWIIGGFLGFSCALYALTGGSITSLAGVFAVAFLGVMCAFAIGNILLKYKRGRLPRVIRVSTPTAFFGLFSMFAGLVGNVIQTPEIAQWFFLYFSALMLVMMFMLHRSWVLKTVFFYLDQLGERQAIDSHHHRYHGHQPRHRHAKRINQLSIRIDSTEPGSASPGYISEQPSADLPGSRNLRETRKCESGRFGTVPHIERVQEGPSSALEAITESVCEIRVTNVDSESENIDAPSANDDDVIESEAPLEVNENGHGTATTRGIEAPTPKIGDRLSRLPQGAFRWKAHRKAIARKIVRGLRSLRKMPCAYLTSTDELHILNKAVLYCKANEISGCLKLVHIYDKEDDIPSQLERNHAILDEFYPKIQIDLLLIQGKFDPWTIRCVSENLGIPLSLFFMSCPGPHFPYSVAELGGARIIML